MLDLPIVPSSSGRASIWPFPDGQRFLIDLPNPDAKSRTNEIWVVVNWFEELKQRVPTGR